MVSLQPDRQTASLSKDLKETLGEQYGRPLDPLRRDNGDPREQEQRVEGGDDRLREVYGPESYELT